MIKKNEMSSGMAVQSLGKTKGKGRGKGSSISRSRLPLDERKAKEEKRIIGSIKHEK
jgi:hypothetical protein